MIKILIVTDDIPAWVKRLTNNFCILEVRNYKTERKTTVCTDLFTFEIRSSFPESMRGACYSCAIYDKYIDFHTDSVLIRRCVKNPIIRTNKYFEGLKENQEV